MIYLYSPYFNEDLIVRIRMKSDSIWADEFHVCESDYTFKGAYKGYLFPCDLRDNDFIRYHEFDGAKRFISNTWGGKFKLIPYRFEKDSCKKILAHPPWYNESLQRNYCKKTIAPQDDDFVILSDVDEILDPEYAEEMMDAASKHGIATCKLHFTMYYFDMFVTGWGGSKGYSNRLFVMTGKYFKHMESSDFIRKKGEKGDLSGEVYLVDKYCGFHHSWLGDAAAIEKKMKAYAHSFEEHKGHTSSWFEECIRSGKNVVNGMELTYRPDIKLIDTVEELREERSDLFWKK